MVRKIDNWLIRLFCIFWAFYLFVDYASYSGYLTQAFEYFEYTGLLITIVIISAGLTYIFSKRKKPGLQLQISNFRNIYVYLFLLLFMGLIMIFYVNQTEITKAKGAAVIMFLIKTIGFHLAILPVLAATFSTGSFLISRTGITLSAAGNFFISAAIGFAIMVAGLFLLGATGLLNQFIVFGFLLLMIVPGWKNIIPFIKNHLIKKLPPFEIHAAAIIPFGFIILLIALNLSYNTRPFPIGFDDLNLYMNVPKLIAGYGALTEGGDAYNWSLVMSLGFVLYKSVPIAMLLSVLPGFFSIIVIYQISRRISISREWSIVASALYYTLPNIIWQSRNDAKVDLALLFITLCGVLLLIEYYFTKNQTKESPAHSKFFAKENLVWVLCGALVGFAFGIKYTSLLSIFAFLVFIFYINAGKKAAAGMFFINFAIIFGLKLTRFAAFDTDSIFLTIAPLVTGIIFFALALKENNIHVFKSIKVASIFCVCIGITFFPWAIKNISENKIVTFETLLTGKSPLPVLYPEMKASTGYKHQESGSPKFLAYLKNPLTLLQQTFSPTNFNSGSLLITIQSPAGILADASGSENKNVERPAEKRDTKYTDKYEEIRRYLGYEKGVIRFISLPYDLAMKTNVRLWSADTGIFFLVIIPIFIFVFNRGNLPANLFKMLLLSFLLISCVLSVNFQSGQFELDKVLEKVKETAFTDSESFRSLLFPVYFFMKKVLLVAGNLMMPLYNTLTFQTVGFSFMIMIYASFLIYFLYKNIITNSEKKTKIIIAFTFTILLCWLILSSGIFWYGMVGFALLTVVMVALIQKQTTISDSDSTFIRSFVTTCIALWFIIILPFQFMPVKFTLVKNMKQVDFNSFIDKPFGKYAIGASSEKEVFRQFFQPAEQNILNVLNGDKKAGILNVSTFLTYHIINNDQRVYTDNQLGIFDRAYQLSNGDRNQVLKELKSKGIKYLLISLYTPTLDMTPEKSLIKKFNNMMTLLVNNPGARLLFTNRVVQRPDGNMPWTVDGKQVPAMYHVAGMRMLSQGSVAMFEIL